MKPRQRKLSKVNDSDTTEYETLSEHSENEAVQVEEEVAEEEVFEEEIIEEKPKTPNPYGYTELHTNIDHIEEFDDGFVSKNVQIHVVRSFYTKLFCFSFASDANCLCSFVARTFKVEKFTVFGLF